MKEDDPVWLFVSVQDTGPGLSDAERAVLFQRFSRTYLFLIFDVTWSGWGQVQVVLIRARTADMLMLAEGSRMVHSRFGGSGLGLYICKRELIHF